MEKLYRILSKVANTTHPVLIVGEPGTGKELVARSIHGNGPNCRKALRHRRLRLHRPFGSSKAELFGYAKGAIPTATKAQRSASSPPPKAVLVFLDEIGDLPLELQTKPPPRPPGARSPPHRRRSQATPSTVRILAATNRDLNSHGRDRPLPQGPLLPPQRRQPAASRRCASASPTSRSSPPTCSTASAATTDARLHLRRRRPASPHGPTTGPATSANSSTPSSAPAPSPAAPSCTSATSPPNSRTTAHQTCKTSDATPSSQPPAISTAPALHLRTAAPS